jgi:hypothetical protein
MKSKESIRDMMRQHFKSRVVAHVHPDADVDKTKEDIKWLRKQGIALVVPTHRELDLLRPWIMPDQELWNKDRAYVITGGPLWECEWEPAHKALWRWLTTYDGSRLPR